MLRLLVIGSSRAVDDLAEPDLLRRWEIEIVDRVSSPTDVSDRDADVLLIADTADASEVLEALPEHRVPAVVALSPDRSVVARIRAAGAPGWALLPPRVSDVTLAAAVVAAASGFRVEPAADDVDAAEADDFVLMESLTARERDVLELVSHGHANRTIAHQLGISEHTVKFHLSSIFSKLGVSSRTEAVRRGVRKGLIQI